MSAFQVGDTIRLKSGGPTMTVTEAAADTSGVDTVWVAWFDKTAKLIGHFPAASVEKVVKSSSSPGSWKTV